MYAVKEAFYSIQGEGHHAGRAAVFCRFAGCNLWSGRERDRARAACSFCDTDFVGVNGTHGGRYADAESLATLLEGLWPARERVGRFVVFTGGEPLLQLDQALVDAMRARGFVTAVETNGSVRPKASVDWICVSPKGSVPLQVHAGDELKLVYPQAAARPDRFADLAFNHFYLQPMDDASRDAHTVAALRWCLDNPQWKLSLQLHKMLGIR